MAIFGFDLESFITDLASGALEDALGDLETGRTNGLIAFPADLDTKALVFTGVKRTRSRRADTATDELLASIALPVPQNLATAYNAQYNVQGIGPVGELAADAGASAAGAFNQAGGGAAGLRAATSSVADTLKGGSVSDIVKGAVNYAVDLNTATAALAGAVAGNLPIGVGAAVAAGAVTGAAYGIGVARNPFLATVFEGTNLRSHSFNYKFIPRNQKESGLLNAILKLFKYYMAPSYALDKNLFNYPDQFTIEFIDDKNTDLFKVGKSVLTDFQVSYTGENGSFFFDETGAPVSVSISMTFLELDIITKDRVLEGY